MSIFSRMRKSRQQAKEHNAKLAEQEKKETEKTPYRHVPTHAATDAIASAPPSWREADRQKIQEQNRRRSAMAASGHHMNMPGAPRVGSSLSHVSYPTDKSATPMRMPRAYSYTGVSPYSASYSRDVAHSMPDVGSQFTAYAASAKGKEAVRVSVSGYSTPRTSPTSSQEESESSSGSTSSQDDLEMRLARPPVVRAPPPLSAADRTGRRPRVGHRHPSDSSIERIAMANSAKGAARDSRPPTSMRGFASIAPIVNAPAPVSRTYTHPQLELPGSLESPEYSLSSSINASLNTSATTLTSTSAPLSTDSNTSPEHNGKYSKERKSAKVTRFTELERIESGAEALAAAPPKAEPEHKAVALAPAAAPTSAAASSPASVSPPTAAPVMRQAIVINVFPEEDSIPEPEPAKKSKRFSKSAGKLSKKSRWASSKAPALTV
ncbi:hypothetical protein HDV57DRAFT_85712 [Trichoderma longibrachiatum]|uniref:Uncharacterized protein n=1 Tax=Trichoderma longibrachiatum ATCC 18648 TaxID=983965 RepID=A0A2T4CEP7_TRILO|nr:hypothetical protein M440DRAFT_1109710 [Trichoderma longibrachiatum ATCC 18648]